MAKTKKEETNRNKSLSLLERMQKTGVIKNAVTLHKSKYLEAMEKRIPTILPIMNIAFSGNPRVGFGKGMTTFAGASKHFKSNYCTIMMADWLKANPTGVALFYDCEGGAKEKYFKQWGVDTSRVLHVPFMDVEQLRNDVVQKLEDVSDNEPLFIMIDSVGGSASRKERETATSKKDENKADMTRAKALSSFARTINPYFIIKDITISAVNHTYMTQETYSKEIMGGGQKQELISNDIFFLSRISEDSEKGGGTADEYKIKDGWRFFIKTQKSRSIMEGRRFPIDITYKGGIAKYSGILEIALNLGVVDKVVRGSKGTLIEVYDKDSGEVLKSVKSKGDVIENEDGTETIIPEISRNGEFWEWVFDNTDFIEKCEKEYVM